MRRLLQEALDKHLPSRVNLPHRAQQQTSRGNLLSKTQHLPTHINRPQKQPTISSESQQQFTFFAQHSLSATNQNSGPDVSPTPQLNIIFQTGDSEKAVQEFQKQTTKPQPVGHWLLQRQASKDQPEAKENHASSTREGRQIHSADPGALMYLPLGGSKSVR